jgi:predicted DNA-binding protein
MKTAISLPDGDFERFERVAARTGMTRSEFYRRAATRYADELEDTTQLTSIAEDALRRAGQPRDELLLDAVRRAIEPGDEW